MSCCSFLPGPASPGLAPAPDPAPAPGTHILPAAQGYCHEKLVHQPNLFKLLFLMKLPLEMGCIRPISSQFHGLAQLNHC